LTNWTATGGTIVREDNGVSSSPYSANADWEAPLTEGTYSVSISLSDSGSFLCGGRQTTVDSIDIIVSNDPNLPPIVEDVTADPSLLLPGESAALACVASDPDEDPVTYSWSAGLGTVTPGAPGTASYTAPLAAVGLDTVTCTVSDGTAEISDTVTISVVGVQGERGIYEAVFTPQRLSADSEGNLYIVDSRSGGLAVINLFTEQVIYRLELSDLTAVAVDWNDNLLLGGRLGADLRDRAGQQILALDPGSSLGDVSDVAVDAINRRYGVLHRSAGRVVVYDEVGAKVAEFGSTGDAADQFRSPQGLAATPEGNWVVADSGQGQIKVFDPAGNLLLGFGDLGGGVGEWVELDDVEVDGVGVIWASDSFQSWVQSFDPDGTPREALGGYGEDVGQFKTPKGLAWVRGVRQLDGFARLVVASTNSSSLQVFRPDNTQVPGPPPAPSAQLSPESLTFPDTGVGQTGPAQNLTLSNDGNALLGVTRITVNGAFTLTNNCGDFVEDGASCVVSVSSQPTAPGASDGELRIETTSQNFAVVLSAQAFVPADVELSPQSLGFNDQEIDTVSDPQVVTLTNPGTLPLEIFSIEASAEYSVTSDCVSPIAAGDSCSLEIRFAPVTIAHHVFGTVQVVSSAETSPHDVQLDGSGIPEIPRFTVTALEPEGVEEGDEGDQFELRFEVALEPPPTTPASVNYETVEGTAAADMDFQTAAAKLVYAPGETSKLVSIALLGDSILEPDEETLSLDLWGPLGALIADGSAVGTIADDELCLSPILIANPGAEVLANGTPIPDWTEGPDSQWVIESEAPEPYEGMARFGAGASDVAELSQTVDLTAFAEPIDSGGQFFEFSGWIQTTGSDTARIVIEFVDADDPPQILAGFDSGDLTSPGFWQQVVDLRTAPPQTRAIRVRLIGQRVDGGDNDAYFDGLSLRSLRVATLYVDDIAEYEGDSGTSDAVFAVQLACPYYQEVLVDYVTRDGSATAGDDYDSASDTVVLPAGLIAQPVAVAILGDEFDEGHESFSLGLENLYPTEVIGLTEEAVGFILNDDFCPLPPAWWGANPDLWPTLRLYLGGVLYEQPEFLEFLTYTRNALTVQLARALTAAKLNRLLGSDPAIDPTLESADQFLALHPPGSKLMGQVKHEARILIQAIDAYNSGSTCSL
jgi:hypothetical protein